MMAAGGLILQSVTRSPGGPLTSIFVLLISKDPVSHDLVLKRKVAPFSLRAECKQRNEIFVSVMKVGIKVKDIYEHEKGSAG